MAEMVASQLEMAQANMEIEVSDCIIANEVSVTKEGEVGDMLQLSMIEDLTSPTVTNKFVEVSRVESETNKEKELTPKAGNKKNLFDIQIKEIDTKLAKFNEGSDSMGCTLKSFKAKNNSISKWIIPKNGRGSRKSAERSSMEQIEADLIANSKNSSNPIPTGTQRTWKRLAHEKAKEIKAESKPICGKRDGLFRLELPSKRREVSKDDDSLSNSMVKAESQPHQSQ